MKSRRGHVGLHARRTGAVVAGALLLAGCPNPNMERQSNYRPLERASAFPDETVARPIPRGTQWRGSGAEAALASAPAIDAAIRPARD